LCSVKDTLVSGYAYTTAAACSLSCNLELAGGDFEFICGGALATGAASSVRITGGGTVTWSIGGAVATGAGSKIIGDLYSVGAVSFGADTTWNGDLVSPTGAVTLGAGAATVRITTTGPVTLGAGATAYLISTPGATTMGAGAQVNVNPAVVSAEAFAFTGDLCNLASPIPPGTYHTAAACVVSCKLQLNNNGESLTDAGNDVTLWEFQCDGALSTAANSGVEFTNDGTADNVLWTIGGAAATGAGSTMVGELISTGAAITGADSTWTGDVTSLAGAAATGAGSTVIGIITAEGAIHVGAKSNTGNLQSMNGAIILGAFARSGTVTPDIAVLGDGAEINYDQLSPTTSPSTFPVEAPSSSPIGTPTYEPTADPYGTPETFSGDLCALQATNGGSVTPGNYHSAAACALITCDLTLDGIGEGLAPAWKFTCGGALSTAASRTMVVNTDASATADVLWSIGAATGTGAGSVMVGNLDSVGAITLGADTHWTGDLESFNGAVATGAGSEVVGDIKAYGAIGLGAGARSFDLTSTHGAVALGASAHAGNCIAAGGVTLGAGATRSYSRLLR
jgi:hypothetical protein